MRSQYRTIYPEIDYPDINYPISRLHPTLISWSMIIEPCNRKFLVFTNGGNNFPHGNWIFISLTCAIRWVFHYETERNVVIPRRARRLRKSILPPSVSRARKITNSIHLNYRWFNQDPSYSTQDPRSLIEVQFRTFSNLFQSLVSVTFPVEYFHLKPGTIFD